MRDVVAALPSPRGMLEESGEMFRLGLGGLARTPRVDRWWGEFVEQCLFIARVSTLPVIAISLPFGLIAALHTGNFAVQLGAPSVTGTVAVIASIRESAPIASALVVSGAAGAAICADLGSRKARDELDAMEVMGVDPILRLVTPRLWASAAVAVLLLPIASVAAIGGAYFYNVMVQGISPGAFVEGFLAFSRVPDLWSGLVKAFVFGLVAGMVACHKGMHVDKSPKAIGEAVNRQVVVCFMLLFVINLTITSIYLALVPPNL